MQFEISPIDKAPITDDELVGLLSLVYVDGGFTPPDLARTLFTPSTVRKRGILFTARNTQNDSLAGMIIVVPPTSNARVIAKNNECEMHLLGVKPEFRSFGVGRLLVEEILMFSKENNWPKMILWTQENMFAAQRLYESCGFVRKGGMSRNDIDFFIYERVST